MNILLEGGTRLQRGPKRSEPGLPLISIVTVTFNAVELFPDTLKTIRAQDYPNVEWIVIDGGSTDGTIDILRANQDVIDYWLSEPDRGMYDALAKGFERANGEILCWLNAGDMFLNGALSIVADVFQSHPEKNWITGMQFKHLPGCKIIGCYIPLGYCSDLIGCGAYGRPFCGRSLPFIEQESTFFRRSMLDGVNMERFREFKLAGDLYLWFCFAKHDKLTVVIAGLGSFCIHAGQLSEDIESYWKEADTFLDRITFALRIKMLVRLLLGYAPISYKIRMAGNAMLTWVKGKGWQ